MKRKTYIQPLLKIVMTKHCSILAGSTLDVKDNTAGEDGWGLPQSVDAEFEEEEEEPI